MALLTGWASVLGPRPSRLTGIAVLQKPDATLAGFWSENIPGISPGIWGSPVCFWRSRADTREV